MHRKVRAYIEKKQLMSPDAKVIVALSGGADSVALLHVLLRLDYKCEAVHCNFHLRGDESLRDEAFVREMCHKMGVGLTVADFDTVAYAGEKKISIEMAARDLRYAFFEKTAAEHGADMIAVAHHKDDVAETMLLNLMRGTGIRGLHGIRPKNGIVVRPLLCVERNEIIEYLEGANIGYVTDSTNLKSDYTRNKVRLQILPLMREINPSIVSTLAQTAERMAGAEKIYDKAIEQGKERVVVNGNIDLASLAAEPSPEALLHEILSPLGFNGMQSDDIMNNIDGDSGKEYSSASHTIVRDRGMLLVEKKEGDSPRINMPLPMAGTIETPQGCIAIEQTEFDGKIDKRPSVAMLDCAKLRLPLQVRNVATGDRFRPFGMRGSKLVSDYLTDRKKSIIEKRNQLVVVDAQGEIVWLVGERVASTCAVTPATTDILRMTYTTK